MQTNSQDSEDKDSFLELPDQTPFEQKLLQYGHEQCGGRFGGGIFTVDVVLTTQHGAASTVNFAMRFGPVNDDLSIPKRGGAGAKIKISPA